MPALRLPSFAVALTTLAVAPLLAGCGGDGDSPKSTATAATTDAPAGGGKVTFATEKEIDCFDPHVSQADVTGVVLRNVYDSLVVQRADGTFGPWLATRWSISADGKAYTFTLRKDVTFTDGDRFDAQAVKENLDRIADPKTKSKFAIALLGPYAGSDVVAPDTVRVRFKERFAAFLHSASTTYLGFHSPSSIAKGGSSLCTADAQVGTGPFALTSYTRGQGLTLKKNPKYAWAPETAKHKGAAYLDRIDVKFVADPTVRVGGVKSGQTDLADFVPPDQAQTLKAAGGASIQATDTPGLGYTYFLNTDNSPFHDKNLRLAVQKAFDLDAAVKTVYFGAYDRAWSVLTPPSLGYDSALKGTWGYDPDGAAKLLDAAGWTQRDSAGYRTKDGQRLATRLLYVPQYTSEDRASLDQALQADLKKAGIELKLVPYDAAPYEPVRNAGKYGIIGFAWGGGDPDLLRTLFDSSQFFDEGGANASRFKDPEVDKWLREGAASEDVETRKADYQKVQQRLIEEAVALPTGVPKRQIAVRDRVKGLAFDANGWPLFYDLSTGKS
jgi:peptide/nickel transport system substrate-binding protein